MAVSNKIFIPTFISSINYEPVRTLPHIYFYNGLKDSEEYFIQHYPSGSTSSVEISSQTKFPYLDYYDGLTPNSSSNSLLFFNETPPYGVAPTGSLYTEYWETYVSLLYNPRTRLFKASAIIPLADYFEMELNDIVQWRGNYYHLRAINDYNLKDGTCKIELLGPIIRDSLQFNLPDCYFEFDSELYVPPGVAYYTILQGGNTSGSYSYTNYNNDVVSGSILATQNLLIGATTASITLTGINATVFRSNIDYATQSFESNNCQTLSINNFSFNNNRDVALFFINCGQNNLTSSVFVSPNEGGGQRVSGSFCASTQIYQVVNSGADYTFTTGSSCSV